MSSKGTARGRRTAIGPSRTNVFPVALSAAAWKGGWAFFADGNMRYSDGIVWKTAYSVTDQFSPPLSTVTSLLEVTVGVGGDYPTLGAALAFMAVLQPSGTQFEYLGRVRILAGTVLAEQVFMYGVNLSWVQITSESATVSVNETAITNLSPLGNLYPFLFFANSGAPCVRCQFNAINPSVNRTVGLDLRNSSYVSQDDPTLAVDAVPPTGHNLPSAFRNFATNVWVGANAEARITSTAIENGRQENVIVSGGRLSFLKSRSRNYGSTGITVASGGVASVFFSDCNKAIATPNSMDLRVLTGSLLSIGPTVLGGTSGANIVPNGDGLIFDARITAPPNWVGMISPQPYTLATLPSAAAFVGSLIYITNGSLTGGPCIAASINGAWVPLTTGATVPSQASMLLNFGSF